MARFSDEFIAAIKERNDIEAVISPYVDLKSRGRIMKGLCPFHNEKTPSFTVYLDTQSYYCFGCGAGGDIISFTMGMENLDYADAVTSLAQRSGLPLPEDGYDDGMARARRRMLEANRDAARFYYKTIYEDAGKTGLDYFLSRGLTHDTIRRFGLGFAPDRWDSLTRHMRSLGYRDDELLSADLARKTKNGSIIDMFRNRVMFPIIDLRGSVIAFGGRVLDDSKPKYLNTSDTLVYKKSQGVFALNLAKRGTDRTLILCEGYMDVIAYHQAGFTNAVAGLGTAFTQEQAKLLSRYADEIILSYDGDEAGQKATKRTMGILEKTPVRIRVAKMTGGKDPDEIIKKFGKERMRAILSGAVNDIEFDLAGIKAGIDTSDSAGKVEYLNKAADVLAYYNDPISRDVYASKLSEELGVSKEAILEQVKRRKTAEKRKENKEIYNSARSAAMGGQTSPNPDRKKNLRAAIAEETLISTLLSNPDFYKEIKDRLTKEDFATPFNYRLYSMIAERIEDCRAVELSYFAGELTPQEMGYLAMLESKRSKLGNTKKECLDCVKVLKEERRIREQGDPSSMSDEQFLNLFKKS